VSLQTPFRTLRACEYHGSAFIESKLANECSKSVVVKELVYTTLVRTEKSPGVKGPRLHFHAMTTRIAAQTFIRVYNATLLRQKFASKVLARDLRVRDFA